MFAKYLFIPLIFLAMTQNASAILPDTLLQNEKQSARCDITELESGLFRPARITIEYNPQIKIITESIGRNDELSSKVDSSRIEGIVNPDGSVVNTLYNVATNQTEHFVFMWQFQTSATPESPKTINFRYISQDNIQVGIDSPRIITDTYCKIVSVKILEPPFVQTPEELAREIEEFHAIRFDTIQLTDRQQTDMLTILVFSVTAGFAIFGVIVFVIFLFSRSNMEKFDIATKNLRTVVGLQRNQITANEYSMANLKNIMDLISLKVEGRIERSMSDFMIFLAGETKKELVRKSEQKQEQKPEEKKELIPSKVMDGLKAIASQFVDIDDKTPKSGEEEIREEYTKNAEEKNKQLYNEMFEVYKKSVEEDNEDKELYKKMRILDEVIHKQILKREVKLDE